METTTRPGTPLRHRMLDDMRMRKFAEHTQAGYIRAVRKLAAFIGRSPDTATTEELRRFQLHLVDTGTGPVTINATITGLRFFFDATLSQPDLMAKMQQVHVPRKLPKGLPGQGQDAPRGDDADPAGAHAPLPAARPAGGASTGYGTTVCWPTATEGNRRANLALARELLHVALPPPVESAGEQSTAPAPTFLCAHCGQAMVVLQVFVRNCSIRAPPPT